MGRPTPPGLHRCCCEPRNPNQLGGCSPSRTLQQHLHTEAVPLQRQQAQGFRGDCPALVDPAPRWWTLPQAGLAGLPRGRSRTRLSLGPRLAPRRLGEATPGRPVHRAPLGQSPPQCAWLGPSSGNVHLEKPEDAHRTFPHAGLGKLEGCGDVCPGLEALEK